MCNSLARAPDNLCCPLTGILGAELHAASGAWDHGQVVGAAAVAAGSGQGSRRGGEQGQPGPAGKGARHSELAVAERVLPGSRLQPGSGRRRPQRRCVSQRQRSGSNGSRVRPGWRLT